MNAPAAVQQFDEGALLRAAAARIAPEVLSAVVDVLQGCAVYAGVAVMLDGVARCMAATESGFVLIEVTPSGERLVVACPLWSIRRVAELASNGFVSVIVELDADRSFVRPSGVDGERMVVPCSYEVSAPSAQSADLVRFASGFRRLLLA